MKKLFLLLLLFFCLWQGVFASLCVGGMDHKFVSAGLVKEADCENFGIQKLKCLICGEVKNEVIKALGGHSWDSGTVTKEATCTENGVKTFKCTRCDKIKEEVISVTEHNWNSKDGNYTDLTCSICGSRKIGYGGKGPAGGFIFYDCDADNASGNADGLKSSECGWRYLEAAPNDLPERYVWGDDGKFGTKREIGEGRNNTDIIVNNASNERKDNAAMACVMYSEGGYSDWFLPSQHELYLAYCNLKMNGIGNYNNYFYWSGTEIDDSDNSIAAYVWDFGDDFRDIVNSYSYCSREYEFYVRPVRAF